MNNQLLLCFELILENGEALFQPRALRQLLRERRAEPRHRSGVLGVLVLELALKLLLLDLQHAQLLLKRVGDVLLRSEAAQSVAASPHQPRAHNNTSSTSHCVEGALRDRE